MKTFLIISSVLLVSSFSYGAKRPSSKQNWDIDKTLNVLKMPSFNRQLLFKKMHPQALRQLDNIVFTESFHMSIRWRALTTIAMYGGKKRFGIIRRASEHPKWFIRNAALVSASHANKKLALKLAKKMRDDQAMVVRAAAVDVLAKHGSHSELELLWKEMDAERNFRKGKGLWIRAKIAKALARVANKSQLHRVVPWLSDNDKAVRRVGVNAMEKITGVALGTPGDSVQARANSWLRWWGNRTKL